MLGLPSSTARRGPALPSLGAIVAGVAALLALGGLGYLAYQRASPAAPPPVQQTAKVARQTITATVTSTGTVQPAASVRLAFTTGGQRIAEVLVSLGEPVSAGQELARLDTSNLELAVLQAEANLRANRAKLDAVLAGARPAEIEIADAQLEAARARLQAMQAGSRQEEIEAAEASLRGALAKIQDLEAGPLPAARAAAQASLHSAQAKLEELRKGPSPQDLAAAQASLQAARAKLDEVLAGPTSFELLSAQVKVEAAQESLNAAQTRQRLATTDAERASATNAMATARANLLEADAKLKEVQQGPTRAEKLDAETTLAQAQAKLASLIPTPAEIAAAEAAVAQAEKALAELSPKEAEVAAARTSVAQALASLAEKVAPHSELDLLIQEQQIRQAEANLVLKRQPYLPADIAAAQAAVAQADANVATALNNLKGATLVAPFDGIVSAVNMSAGDVATTSGTGATAITIVDLLQLRVDVQVDESDISHVAVGQRATLNFDSLPGQRFRGRVAAIAPSGTLTQGVVGYQVSILLPEATGVLPGMTATAEIVHDRREDVLAIPNRAVSRQGRDRYVEVVAPIGTERRKVELGLAGDDMVEITAGLSEDEVVLIPQTAARAAIPGARGRGTEGFGGFGGGFGGGPGGDRPRR